MAIFRAWALALVILCSSCRGTLATMKKKHVSSHEDTFTAAVENAWFRAENHLEEINDYVTNWIGKRTKHCLDAFGASKRMKSAWLAQGREATAFDVTLNKQDDIVMRSGFFRMVDRTCELVDHGLIVAGPPCSVFGFLSCSVHKRYMSQYGVEGDTSLHCVRLSNRITTNFATLLRVCCPLRNLLVVVEQPADSWMFKLPVWQTLIPILCLIRITTHMGCFGHPMCKATHLLSNLPGIVALTRKMTKKLRQKIKAKQRRSKKSYLVKDGPGKVHGGKHLQSSAKYTATFANAMYKAWSDSHFVKTTPQFKRLRPLRSDQI